jgi:hypothetical protein
MSHRKLGVAAHLQSQFDPNTNKWFGWDFFIDWEKPRKKYRKK